VAAPAASAGAPERTAEQQLRLRVGATNRRHDSAPSFRRRGRGTEGA
jgi:hypothetical protein